MGRGPVAFAGRPRAPLRRREAGADAHPLLDLGPEILQVLALAPRERAPQPGEVEPQGRELDEDRAQPPAGGRGRPAGAKAPRGAAAGKGRAQAAGRKKRAVAAASESEEEDDDEEEEEEAERAPPVKKETAARGRRGLRA